jgi:anti-sigma regulatory factor (Ser/Thr protein kinase)
METNNMLFDKEITIPATIEELDHILEWVSDVLEENCSGKISNQIAVVAEELFVNISSYAYSKKSGDVTIRVSIAPARLIIQFEDSGIAFNPLEHELPDVNAGIEDRKIGGLGIYLTRKWMSNVIYHRENEKNILTIMKEI